MQTAAQITDNYRAVRARLWGSPTVGRVVLPRRAEAPEKPAAPAPINWKIVQVKGRKKRRKALPQGVFEPTVQAACAKWGVERAEVFSDVRKRACVLARIEIIQALHSAGWTYCGIGKWINKDHSSVLHLQKKYPLDGEAYLRLAQMELESRK